MSRRASVWSDPTASKAVAAVMRADHRRACQTIAAASGRVREKQKTPAGGATEVFTTFDLAAGLDGCRTKSE
jgi:hypothetical protein